MEILTRCHLREFRTLRVWLQYSGMSLAVLLHQHEAASLSECSA